MHGYTLPSHVLQDLVAYLEGRPFREVVGLLNQIGSLVQQQNRDQSGMDSSTA